MKEAKKLFIFFFILDIIVFAVMLRDGIDTIFEPIFIMIMVIFLVKLLIDAK